MSDESTTEHACGALLPTESVALTVGLRLLMQGEDPGMNVAVMCVLALARITGRHDWTADTSTEDQT